MKKILFVITICIMLGFNGLAQADGFFSDWYCVDCANDNLPNFPNAHGDSDGGDSTPIGSGTLILTTIGIGYVLVKRKSEKVL